MIYWRYEAEEIRQGFNFYPAMTGVRSVAR